jgi:hypothetical protein
MNKRISHRNLAPIPTLFPPPVGKGGKGVGKKCKTTIQGLPGKMLEWRCDVPDGNRSTAKACPAAIPAAPAMALAGVPRYKDGPAPSALEGGPA